jgi:FkbM family methyltransferase
VYRSALETLLRRFAAQGEPLQRSFSDDAPAYFSVGPACQVENVGGLYEKYLGAIDDGFYVEIGAFDGVSHSNTLGLARRGWSGVLVEPHPLAATKLRENYANFPKIAIEQVAVGKKDGEIVNLSNAGTLSSTSADLTEHYKRLPWASGAVLGGSQEVESMRLDTLLERHGPDRLDLLVVDVEGSEEAVFSGFDLKKWKPQMVIVELTENHPDFHNFRQGDARLYLNILEAGYVPVFKDSVNTVFVESNRFREINLLGL